MGRILDLPVRWWGDGDTYQHRGLRLSAEETAFVLVDCDGAPDPDSYDHETKLHRIAPALAAARAAGLRVVYFHNAPGGGGPGSAGVELHGAREGKDRPVTPAWKPVRPAYYDELRPLGHEAEFQKAHRGGFRDTSAARYLRTWGIGTLVIVGFSLKSCVLNTCVGAEEHDFRVIVLRDCVCPPGTKEFPDTFDPGNPEGGWMRYAVLRLIETNIGYTSTAREFVRACGEPGCSALPGGARG